MPRPLLLFDLDGCLIDSTPAITGSIRHALGALGVAAPPAPELTWCVGPPLRDSLATLLADAGDDPARAPEAMDAYRAHYADTATTLTAVIPGIEVVLDQLARDATLAVVTSKPGEVAAPLIDGLGLAPRFAAVHAPVADHNSEPKAVTLGRALADLANDGGLEDAVMIGDRSFDIVAGHACGTATVGVTWGAGSREELAQAGADAVIDTPAALPSALRRVGTSAQL